MVLRYAYCLGIILRLFCQFFHSQNTWYIHSAAKMNRYLVYIMCMYLLLQFYADSFETLQVLRSWAKDVHIVWI